MSGRRWSRRCAGTVAALALVPAALAAQASDPWAVLGLPRTHAARATGAAITPADLRTRLYIFSDDSMGGRRLGAAGNAKGVEYLAAEARRIGLEPLGDDGTFFQTVPVVDNVFDSTVAFSVDGSALQPWTDFVPRYQGSGARSLDGVTVVYGGVWGGDSTALISNEAAAGKLVVLAIVPAGYSNNTPGTANRFALAQRYRDAAGIAIAGRDLLPAASIAFYRTPAQGVRPDEAPPLPSFIYVTGRVAALMLGAGLDTARVGTIGRTVRGTPTFREQSPAYPARNVVGLLRGGDPARAGEFVAIGAHNDHIGTLRAPVAHDSIYIVNHLFRAAGDDDPEPKLTPARVRTVNAALAMVRRRTAGRSARPDSIFNGADDDGSGSVSLLEIAEYLVSRPVRPKRSVLFVWHVGEEEGLYGAQYFTDHPTVPRDAIVAQLNIDMIGRGSARDVTGAAKGGGSLHGDANYVQLIGARRLSSELGALAETTNRSGRHGLHFDYAMDANGHPQNIYCRSDHYEYARYGIPIIFFTTGGHADYHQVTDEAQYIDYGRMARIARFVTDLATRVANLDHRVVVDRPKPDPRGVCRQ